MMTDALRVSVVAAPLAAIDPRVLSQAWFSALHLARERAIQPRVSHAIGRERRRPEATVAETNVTHREPRPAPQPHRAQSVETMRAKTSDSPVARTHATLARRVEVAIARRAGAPARATFVVADGAKRALIVLQTRGSTTHVVAICAPAHRQAVALALSQARSSLLARGIAFRSRIEANGACS